MWLVHGVGIVIAELVDDLTDLIPFVVSTGFSDDSLQADGSNISNRNNEWALQRLTQELLASSCHKPYHSEGAALRGPLQEGNWLLRHFRLTRRNNRVS